MGTQERERGLTERVGVLVRGVSVLEEGGRSASGTLGRGKGLWAPGLARGPAVKLAVPRPAKAPPARQHQLCPREATGLGDISACHHSGFSGLVASLLLRPQPPGAPPSARAAGALHSWPFGCRLGHK